MVCEYTDEVVEAWGSYFQELASPTDHRYDSSLTQALAEHYRIDSVQIPLDEFPNFTCDEVKEVVHSLKLNKP